jgi:CheY-like chemotaxis protein
LKAARDDTPGQLVVIGVVAAWEPACMRFQQILERLNGLYQAQDKTHIKLHLFDYSSSRFLLETFKLRSVPAVFIYYQGRLVHAFTSHGKPFIYKHRKQKLLVVEPDPLLQYHLEKSLRKGQYDWNLAMNSESVQRVNSSVQYALILMDLDLVEDAEQKEITQYVLAHHKLGGPEVALVGMSTDPTQVSMIDYQTVLQKPVSTRTLVPFLKKTLKGLQRDANTSAAAADMNSDTFDNRLQTSLIVKIEAALLKGQAGDYLQDGFHF